LSDGWDASWDEAVRRPLNGQKAWDKVCKRSNNVVKHARLVSLISLQRFLLSQLAPQINAPNTAVPAVNFSSSTETSQLGRLLQRSGFREAVILQFFLSESLPKWVICCIGRVTRDSARIGSCGFRLQTCKRSSPILSEGRGSLGLTVSGDFTLINNHIFRHLSSRWQKRLPFIFFHNSIAIAASYQRPIGITMNNRN
jgi:hypothetical protein